MKSTSDLTDIEVNQEYELYQIIKDFGDPIQIFREAFQNSIDEEATEVYCHVYEDSTFGSEDLYIDIWDNGTGLDSSIANSFFDLARSTKFQDGKPKQGKLGYKGHGTKIFFNSERIEIVSKTASDKEAWGAFLDDPIEQIREKKKCEYSKPTNPQELGFKFGLPSGWKHGFFIRIKNPHYFATTNTRYLLNHMYLRDYSTWYTAFGSVRKNQRNAHLFLHGLGIEDFEKNYSDIKVIDPVPSFDKTKTKTDGTLFEKIAMGHYFPDERDAEQKMKKYANKLGYDAKTYYHYYAKKIFDENVTTANGTTFYCLIFSEGYETKRRYDKLLSRRGKPPLNLDRKLLHTDADRYGLWACKGGIPVEKIDDWIEGGKGVYSYLHAFIDSDKFELTANRGSIRNTDLQTLTAIKEEFNKIFNAAKIKNLLEERRKIEDLAKTAVTIEEDKDTLQKRYRDAKKRKLIELPNKAQIIEPTKNKSGYSESETAILLVQLIIHYPNLFPFTLMDYNTTSGIDFVVEGGKGSPNYIELKGTMQKDVNHSFKLVSKFICYDINLKPGDKLTDTQNIEAILKENKQDKFPSNDENFKGKTFTSYVLQPTTIAADSMEIIVLKQILRDILKVSV